MTQYSRTSLSTVIALMACIGATGADAAGLANAKALTPAQEAYFVTGLPFDQKLWEEVDQSFKADTDRVLYSQAPGTRFRGQLFPGSASKVCRAWLHNQNLWGGAMVGGCNSVEPHPALRDKKFQLIEWTPVDPRDHVDVIRNMYIAIQPSAGREFRNAEHPDYYWRKMAPIIKRLLEADQIRMEQATFDAINGGKPKRLFAITLSPHSVCLSASGRPRSDHTWTYMEGSGPLVNSFNQLGLGGQFFMYEGRTYVVKDSGLFDIVATEPGTNAPKATVIPECEIHKVRR